MLAFNNICIAAGQKLFFSMDLVYTVNSIIITEFWPPVFFLENAIFLRNLKTPQIVIRYS